jgi:hypothetical protein
VIWQGFVERAVGRGFLEFFIRHSRHCIHNYSYSTSTCRHCILALRSSLSSVINCLLFFNRMKK